MEFREAAEALSRIEATRSKLEMAQLMSELFRKASAEELRPLVYLVTGRIAPEYANVESGLSSRLLVDALVEATRLPAAEVERAVTDSGDLGEAAQALVARRPQTALFSEPLGLVDVFERLKEIARSQGKGSQERKLKLLSGLLHDCSPLEARYAVRIVNGSLRIGSADMIVIDALSLAFATKEQRGDVEDAFSRCSDLGRVADAMRRDGIGGVAGILVEVGVPLRPMLAERLGSIADILEKMGGRAVFEFKYDGLRVQAHVGESVKLFSRRMEDITGQFPDLVEALSSLRLGGGAIIEGEAVPVDGHGAFLPFQEVSRRRGRKHGLDEAMSSVPVKLVLFDCLYLNGKSLLASLLPERRRALISILPDGGSAGTLMLSRSLETSSVDEAEEFFLEALEQGCEGVMAKSVDEDSRYRAGARGWQWIKYKSDYVEALTDSLDLAIVGGYAGRGRRTGWYGGFLMACRDADSGRLQTVCKLGSGFNDADLAALKDELDPLRRKEPPAGLDFVKTPDVWFEPTVVIEVVAAELTVSPGHTAASGRVEQGKGLALRFPRYSGRRRNDKGAGDITDASEIIRMYELQRKKVKADRGVKK